MIMTIRINQTALEFKSSLKSLSLTKTKKKEMAHGLLSLFVFDHCFCTHCAHLRLERKKSYRCILSFAKDKL
jgi:hypothetical protein